MSLIQYTKKVSQSKNKEIQFPPITRGETSERSALVMPPEMAERLINCKYVQETLQIGRGGLEMVNTTAALSASISHIVSASVAGATSKYVSSGTGVYKLTGTSFGSSLLTTAGPSYLIPFNDNLIICDGGQTKRWDGTHCFVIGSHKDTITEKTVDGGTNIYTGTSKTVSWTTANDGYYRRVIRVSAYMKKTGSPTGTIKATIGTTDSVSLNVTTDITTTYATVHFDFTTPVDLAANATGDIVFSMTGGDSSNYVTLGSASTVDMVMVNGPYAPAATFGYVRNAKLYLGGDSSNKEKIYFSNVNLPDDFFSTSQTAYTGFTTYGGYFSFNDDAAGEALGINEVYGSLVVCGTSGGQKYTTLLDSDHAISRKFKGGSIGAKTLSGSTQGLFFVHETGVSYGTGSDKFGDLTFGTVSDEVKSRFISQDNTSAFICYNSSSRQMWIQLPDDDYVQVFNMDRGQWTRYIFSGIGTVTSFTDIDGTMHVGDSNGYMYLLNELATTDNGKAITYDVITKRYNFSAFVRTLLKGLFWNVRPSVSMSATVTVMLNQGSVTYDYNISTSSPKIYSSTSKIYIATYAIISMAVPSTYRFNHNVKSVKFRMSDITLESIPAYVGEMNLYISSAGREK